MKINPFKNTIFHADDFAACPEVSQHILDCKQNGILHSVSILANSPYLQECMQMLSPYTDTIKCNIHFNIAEGPCLSNPSDLSLLVNEQGMFCISFFKILLMACGKKRTVLKQQLELELSKQLHLLLPYLDKQNGLRIDSHQHYHMIPIVLDAILSVASKSGQEITFIRIPSEPIIPFLKHPSLYLTYRPINFVKNIVLNILKYDNAGRLKPYHSKTAIFFGILMSGHMDLNRVSVLLPDFIKLAKKKKMPLEILAHPGGVSDVNELLDPDNGNCKSFYMSSGRNIEKEMLLQIAETL